ncbi:general stress protein [Nesterenkonia xinjiangensis]|uniref:General stress protein 17M-like domain-containing protein n=2 Tax=Nesterenkonia xinjiangensis TaxID=225327 RepID=A0A7Z0GMY8_9MICC|nr:general stress protein [Nesterenkonia xinjiangensis]NYJ78882.1 hypothetical protein [Nesterenkonia xinjiangensis]
MTSPQNSGLPRGELLGRYRSYEDAQKVVDHLAAAEDFDIKTLSIVGNDLRTVEHIRRRLSYPRVAGAGAAQGAMFGAFIGLLIVLFSPEAGIPDLLLAVLLGMAIWMIVGVISYAIRRGQRDFASSSQLVATTFDVVCDFSVAHRARQLVAGAGVRGVTAYDDPTSQPLAPAHRPHAAPARTVAAPQGGSEIAGAPAAGTPAAPAPPDSAHRGQPAAEDQARQDAVLEPTAQFRTGYDDLPDGRPRFGVRVMEQSQEQGEAQRDVPDGTAPEETAPGEAPQDDAAQDDAAQRPGERG